MAFVRSVLRSILRGQALVETALIAPILIFILIGVFEVGWALRGYLVLIQANREATRFAVRPGYINYENEFPDYTPIIKHLDSVLSDQIPFFEQGGVVIVSRIKVDTQWVCNLEDLPCNCETAITHPFSPTIAFNTYDLYTYTFKYPVTTTEVTRLDYNKLKEDAIQYNLKHNCDLMNRGGLPAIEDIIYVEMFYNQPQLFGFPLISNPILDPVPMYAHSAFRRVVNR